MVTIICVNMFLMQLMQKSMSHSQKNLQEQESKLKKITSQLEKSSEEMIVLKEMLQVSQSYSQLIKYM